MRFRVLIELRGVPARARDLETAQIVLASACSDLVEAPPQLAGNNNAIWYLAGWCTHPNLVPNEKLIFIPEPPAPYVECGLFPETTRTYSL